jgi:hypothetical protein
MSVTFIPQELLKKRVFVAGGFAIYCSSMLFAVGIAERLHKKFRLAEQDCPLFGEIDFRGSSYYWVRFPFLRWPGAYTRKKINCPY